MTRQMEWLSHSFQYLTVINLKTDGFSRKCFGAVKNTLEAEAIRRLNNKIEDTPSRFVHSLQWAFGFRLMFMYLLPHVSNIASVKIVTENEYSFNLNTSNWHYIDILRTENVSIHFTKPINRTVEKELTLTV